MAGAFSRFATWLSQGDNALILLSFAVARPFLALTATGFF